MRRALVGLALLALLASGTAVASERHPTLAELESEVICPTCKTTLDQSRSPIADRMRRFISQRIAAGDTKTEIKQKLVDQFGESVLAAPPRHGFGLLAWVLPLAGIGVGALVAGALAWRWSRTRGSGDAAPPAALDPELERRLDDELARFDD